MPYWIAPHLAFLVQWLRILGVDCRLWNKEMTLGAKEGIVVQWDRYPLPFEETQIKMLTLSSSTREDLLKEFFKILGIQPSLPTMFKRCLRCNTPLISLTPEEAKERWSELPPYVFQTQKQFNWCDQCRQLFWAGTHVRNMIRTLADWQVISKDKE